MNLDFIIFLNFNKNNNKNYLIRYSYYSYTNLLWCNLLDLLDFYEDKVILVAGGTGTIGSEIVTQLLNYNPKTIRILSNTENELWETKLKFNENKEKLRYLLGDIRDLERVKRAMDSVDYVFNAAAIKHVPVSEYNPMEAINVNIHGLENIIESAFYWNVKKLLYISTDKAVNPTSVMGATKMLGERLCISREFTKGTHPTIISCVRFGNVLGSRGSIIPLIKKQIENGNSITLTDEKMKRFFMSISQAVDLVLKSMVLAYGGEIFVLKMPIIAIKDLLEVMIEEYAPKIDKDPSSVRIELIGAREGEKMHEELISPIEFSSCYETDKMYIIYPMYDYGYINVVDRIKKIGTPIKVNENFNYNTVNKPSLSKTKIKELLIELNLI